MILDPVLPQGWFDDHVCFRKIPPGKLGKKVMFDLIVQTTQASVDDRSACHIGRCQNLLPDDSVYMPCLEELGQFMVRSENGTVVEAEYALVNQHEEKCVPAAQKMHEEHRVDDHVSQDDRKLKPLVLWPVFEEVGDTRPPSVHCLKTENERKYESLRLHQRPEPFASSDCLFGAECDERDAYVGIFIEVVRVGMMSVMLVDPPGVGECEQEIPVHEVQDIACPLSIVENLPVTEVMRQKCYLR